MLVVVVLAGGCLAMSGMLHVLYARLPALHASNTHNHGPRLHKLYTCPSDPFHFGMVDVSGTLGILAFERNMRSPPPLVSSILEPLLCC